MASVTEYIFSRITSQLREAGFLCQESVNDHYLGVPGNFIESYGMGKERVATHLMDQYHLLIKHNVSIFELKNLFNNIFTVAAQAKFAVSAKPSVVGVVLSISFSLRHQWMHHDYLPEKLCRNLLQSPLVRQLNDQQSVYVPTLGTKRRRHSEPLLDIRREHFPEASTQSLSRRFSCPDLKHKVRQSVDRTGLMSPAPVGFFSTRQFVSKEPLKTDTGLAKRRGVPIAALDPEHVKRSAVQRPS